MITCNPARLAWWLALASNVAAVDIAIKADGGNATNGHQYGFLHEDINNSGDGGLYAELVRNRAFQSSYNFSSNLDAWFSLGGASLSLTKLDVPLSKALSTSMNVGVDSAGDATEVGFFNDGYWGMDVKKANLYTGSFWVKGSYEGQFKASFRSNITGEIFGSATIQSKCNAADWIEHTYELRPDSDAPNSNNTLAITFNPSKVDGSLNFNLISLFPPTFKGRKNGMRIDIAEALAELHPTLFRIPGGNMLEGLTLGSWWDWKDSLGPLKDRSGFSGVWQYPQTHGLGLLEYLEFAEDLNMELIVGVYSGLALDGNFVAKDKLQPFIDDALDQIEFIRGSVDTKWGAKRAELGHPKPFKLAYVEVGNEDWLAGRPAGWDSYKEYRFPMFLEAINKAYPDIQVISSGSQFDNYEIPAPGAGDYHLYAEPDQLIEQWDRFDNVEIPHLIGEMAATHPNGGTSWDGPMRPWPWWGGAVAEAVGLISYERNQDRIIGAAYAPVLRNLNRWQWPITIIHSAADPALTTRSTSWFIWELFAGHVFTETLPASSETGFNPLFYVTGKNDVTGGHIFKGAVYNSTNGEDVPVRISFEGVEGGVQAELTLLTGPEDPYGYNDPWTGINVVDTTKSTLTADKDGVFSFDLPNLSVAVLDTAPKYPTNRNKVFHVL